MHTMKACRGTKGIPVFILTLLIGGGEWQFHALAALARVVQIMAYCTKPTELMQLRGISVLNKMDAIYVGVVFVVSVSAETLSVIRRSSVILEINI